MQWVAARSYGGALGVGVAQGFLCRCIVHAGRTPNQQDQLLLLYDRLVLSTGAVTTRGSAEGWHPRLRLTGPLIALLSVQSPALADAIESTEINAEESDPMSSVCTPPPWRRHKRTTNTPRSRAAAR